MARRSTFEFQIFFRISAERRGPQVESASADACTSAVASEMDAHTSAVASEMDARTSAELALFRALLSGENAEHAEELVGVEPLTIEEIRERAQGAGGRGASAGKRATRKVEGRTASAAAIDGIAARVVKRRRLREGAERGWWGRGGETE